VSYYFLVFLRVLCVSVVTVHFWGGGGLAGTYRIYLPLVVR